MKIAALCIALILTVVTLGIFTSDKKYSSVKGGVFWALATAIAWVAVLYLSL